MHKVHGVLIAEPRIQPIWRAAGPAPRLRLLIELEPRHRVFFRNLTDLLLSRRLPPVFISARPAPFWNDVFVGSSTSWTSFVESMLAHLLLIIVLVWSQSRVWAPVKLFRRQDTDALRSSITYTPPAQSFRTAESRALSVPARSRVRSTAEPHATAQQQAWVVRAERQPGIVTPPDIKQATAELPDFPSAALVTPMVPFSATSGLRPNALSGTPTAVGPAPQVNQATSRRLALPQLSAVAPAPELGRPPIGRAVKTAGFRVVEPPPSLQTTSNAPGAARLNSLSGTGPGVAPPPPLVQGRGNIGNGRLASIAGASSPVIPPPPSVQASSGLSRGSRSIGVMGNSDVGGLISGDRSQIIPPPPSAASASNSSPRGHFGPLLGDGTPVVPPPPTVEGAGTSAGYGRLGSLSGSSAEIVPPAPLIEGAGNSGSGERAGSLLLSGSHLPIVPPAPSVAGAGSDSGASGAKATESAPISASPASATPSSAPAVDQEVTPTIEELPLGLLGLVFAPPGTSYFSNFEVFVAKRRVGRDQLQLIKLVYEFLPYQRRLSEYDLYNVPLRFIKLRVTLDPSCNESLGKMIAPSTDSDLPSRKYPELPAELRDSDRNAVLPCYRTNAEDFRKAMARAR